MQTTAFRLLCCATLFCSAFTASAERVAVIGTDASFEPPAGFKELSAGEIALKFNRGGNPPKSVLGNEGATTTVAYEIRPIPATEADLPEMLAAFDQQFQQRVPGLMTAHIVDPLEAVQVQKSHGVRSPLLRRAPQGLG